MISPIRGDFTGFRVQVPPRTHRDHDLTCGYAIGEHSPESGARLFLQVRTMGVQVGSRLRNGNSHRQPTGLRILRDVHKREVVASGIHWGEHAVAGCQLPGSRTAQRPTSATSSTPQTRHRSERRHIGFPAKAHIAGYTRLTCPGANHPASGPCRFFIRPGQVAARASRRRPGRGSGCLLA